MTEMLETWATDSDARRAVEERLAELRGRKLAGTRYLIPNTADSAVVRQHDGFDEVSMGVEIAWEDGTCEFKWLMRGEREGLAIVFDPTAADLERDRLRPLSLSQSLSWGNLLGLNVTGVGVSWHLPTAGVEAIWAVRLQFNDNHQLVLALGEWRDGQIRYIPDTVVAIFDATIAADYKIPAAHEPAWGHDV